MMRLGVYVDGFNLYKGALETRTHLKWLNLIEYVTRYRQVEPARIVYFTARVKARYQGDRANERQATLLKVMKDSGVEVVYGKLQMKIKKERFNGNDHRLLIAPQLPIHFGLTKQAFSRSFQRALPDEPRASIRRFEEKGSDVNLASYLLRDVFLGNIDEALVITGDTDLVTPVRMTKEFGIPVEVQSPIHDSNLSLFAETATSISRFDLEIARASQFPNRYVMRNGREVFIPRDWA